MIQFTLFALFDCSLSSCACQYYRCLLHVHPVLACMSYNYNELYLFSFSFYLYLHFLVFVTSVMSNSVVYSIKIKKYMLNCRYEIK